MLGKKRITEKAAQVKKLKKSKVEENIIKRIRKYRNVEQEEALKQEIKQEQEHIEKVAYDLWAVEKPDTKRNSLQIQYPKVPLPHPGQSYNPAKNDLKHLLTKVVEYNKPIEHEPESTMPSEVKPFDESDSDSGVDPNEPISNNPAILSTDKLSRKERNKLKKKMENRKINEEQHKLKQQRIDIHSVKDFKNFEKVKEKSTKKQLEVKEKKVKEEQAKQHLMQIGVVEDPDLIEDFQIKQEGQTLRNLKVSNIEDIKFLYYHR